MTTSTTTARPSTARQIAFIARLQAERGQTPMTAANLLTARQASQLIDRLLATPRPAAPAPTAPPITATTLAVPAGLYAVDGTGHQPVDFYRVDRPTEGRWAGRIFVKIVVGGRSDAPVRGAAAVAVLARIEAAGPLAAAQRYGQEIGRCGRCNRRLTDETSRQIGIGPDCRSLDGWGGTAHTHTAPEATETPEDLGAKWFDADEPAA